MAKTKAKYYKVTVYSVIAYYCVGETRLSGLSFFHCDTFFVGQRSFSESETSFSVARREQLR